MGVEMGQDFGGASGKALGVSPNPVPPPSSPCPQRPPHVPNVLPMSPTSSPCHRSSESETSLKRKTLRLLEKLQELAVSCGVTGPSPPWGLRPGNRGSQRPKPPQSEPRGCPQVSPKATTCPQPQHRDLARRVEELQEKLDEETKVTPGRTLGTLGGTRGGR